MHTQLQFVDADKMKSSVFAAVLALLLLALVEESVQQSDGWVSVHKLCIIYYSTNIYIINRNVKLYTYVAIDKMLDI